MTAVTVFSTFLASYRADLQMKRSIRRHFALLSEGLGRRAYFSLAYIQSSDERRKSGQTCLHIDPEVGNACIVSI